MWTPVDLHKRHENALDRLGPPLAPSRLPSRMDPHRRAWLRERLVRLGSVGLRDRLGTAGAAAFAR